MKKKISRIWGVGLVLVLVVGLLAWSAPALAGNDLQWDDEDIPSTDDYILLDGSNIVDLAVATDGLVIYAATDGDEYLYVSSDKGLTWDRTSVVVDSATINTAFVAVAPDDPQYIAVANSYGTVYISDDSGTTWDSLGTSSDTGISTVSDLDISRAADNHFVALAGYDGTDAEVAVYEIGAIGAAWDATSDNGGFTSGDNATAVAFSPNFHSDEILVAISVNTTSDHADFQMYSFNQEKWNASAGFADYSFDILDDTTDNFTASNKASISLGPDYLGSDADLRIVFVGLATDQENETSGIFRLDDDDVTVLKDEKQINSVAFDGTKLLAGRYDDTDVYRSSDPLVSSPDVSGSASKKGPGGEDKVLVGWAGDLAIAATQGDGSCFSISRNYGKSFNDMSLIDNELDVLTDIVLSPGGSTTYLSTWDSDSADLSVWRAAEGQDADWERILFDDGSNAHSDYIVRFAPADPDVVFLADKGGTNIYYSSDAGETRWRTRSSRYDIADLAVETTGEVLYVLVEQSAGCYVSKSTNTGFTWGTRQTTSLADGPNMILSLGEDLVIVGSDGGTASYSTDGNESWYDFNDEAMGNGAVQVTAQGLATNDFVFASTNATADHIYRWQIGVDDEWDDFDDLESGFSATGIALSGNVLYVLAYHESDNTSTVYRFLDATKDDPTRRDIDSAADIEFNRTPSALRMTGNVLWTIDTFDTQKPYSLEDTVAVAVPTLQSPADGFTVGVNPVSGNINNVSLIWESPSDEVTEFDLEVAFDADFDQLLKDEDITAGGPWDEGDVEEYELSGSSLAPGTTYYWRVRVDQPFRSGWATRSIQVAEAEVTPPVEITPAPPAPEIKVEVPPAPKVELPAPVVEVPPPPAPIAPAYIWGIIVIGALLVIALIVLIIRTRRVV